MILNVLTPEFGEERQEGLPVAVLIHGGGYDGGDAEWFPGEAMIDASGGEDSAPVDMVKHADEMSRQDGVGPNPVSTGNVGVSGRQCGIG